MGNSETKSELKGDDCLKDYSVGINIPSHISKPTSNWLLAYSEGNYYPCIILDRAKQICNGYLVFFLHSQIETEIPCSNVVGNFKALLDCKVSFTLDGRNYVGKVIDMAANDRNEITNFFVTCADQCAWISLPFLYLSIGQARQLS